MRQSSIIEKVILLLKVLGSAARPLSFVEIVKASNLNKSSVHRLLNILMSQGFVNYNEATKSYLLGYELLQLSKHAWRGFDLQVLAFDEMIRLNAISQENVSIAVLLGNEVMHLKMIESQNHWGTSHPPVFNQPAHTTAVGKAIAAFIPEKIRVNWLNQYEFTRSTKRSITDKDTFEKHLGEVRKQGYAYTDREEMDYVVGIAAPIFNFLDEPIAAINIWAPTNRCAVKDLFKWSDEIITSAGQISKLIGSDHYQARSSLYLV